MTPLNLEEMRVVELSGDVIVLDLYAFLLISFWKSDVEFYLLSLKTFDGGFGLR